MFRPLGSPLVNFLTNISLRTLISGSAFQNENLSAEAEAILDPVHSLTRGPCPEKCGPEEGFWASRGKMANVY